MVKHLLLVPALFLLVSLAACGDDTLSLFFDIPPPTPEEKAAVAAAEAKEASPSLALPTQAPATGNEERPAIESVTTWEQAQEMLPKDDIDEVDWVAALRDGTIRPRTAIAMNSQIDPRSVMFNWDFYFPGPDPSFDAYFPHSSHTEWLTCKSCHPVLFRYRELEVTMDRIFEGDFCGACHGSVAFDLENCARCHTSME